MPPDFSQFHGWLVFNGSGSYRSGPPNPNGRSVVTSQPTLTHLTPKLSAADLCAGPQMPFMWSFSPKIHEFPGVNQSVRGLNEMIGLRGGGVQARDGGACLGSVEAPLSSDPWESIQ